MNDRQIPTFVWIPKTDISESMINLNLIRSVELRKTSIRLCFSETHAIDLTGDAVPELLSLLENEYCITTTGEPLLQALARARSQLRKSEQSAGSSQGS